MLLDQVAFMESAKQYNQRPYTFCHVLSFNAWQKTQRWRLNGTRSTEHRRRPRRFEFNPGQIRVRVASCAASSISIKAIKGSVRFGPHIAPVISRDVGPNITGTFGVFQNTDKFYVDNVVFTSNTSIGRRGPQGTDNGICTNFNATGASSIYGHSSTVQPKALQLIPCIKT